MELPPELTRILPGSLEVLRYMGQTGIDSTDMDALAEGMGMSDRAVQRAIRGLVTQGYLNMDNDYIYYLTEKGTKAVQALAAYDAAQPSQPHETNQQNVIHQQLAVVLPNPLGSQHTSALQVGIVGSPPISETSHLVLRFSASSGTVSPPEVTLELEAGASPAPAETFYTPIGQTGQVRFRVEAFQLVGVADVHPAGGMFFDVMLGESSGEMQAWYGSVELQA